LLVLSKFETRVSITIALFVPVIEFDSLGWVEIKNFRNLLTFAKVHLLLGHLGILSRELAI
jgi:hypothetical protein